jgi:hypothetical protein
MTSTNANDLRNSAANAVDQLQRAAGPAIKEGKRQVGVLLDQSGELVDSVSSRLSETAADLGKSLLTYTKKNPLAALLLAVGAGALLIGAANLIRSRR